MQLKLLRLLNPGSCCLEALYVASVGELGLGVTAAGGCERACKRHVISYCGEQHHEVSPYDVKVEGWLKKHLVLLLGTLVPDGGDPHRLVETERCWHVNEELGHLHVLLRPLMLLGELDKALLLAQTVFELVGSAQVVDGAFREGLFSLNDAQDPLHTVKVLLRKVQHTRDIGCYVSAVVSMWLSLITLRLFVLERGSAPVHIGTWRAHPY